MNVSVSEFEENQSWKPNIFDLRNNIELKFRIVEVQISDLPLRY